MEEAIGSTGQIEKTKQQPTDAQVLAFIQAGRPPANNMKNLMLLFVSIVLFAGTGMGARNPRFLGLLILTILIHELGHLLAMKVYGYKNLKMLFIPMLGAMASGQSDEHDSYKIALISLSGPLVGLLTSAFAVLLYMFTRNALFLEYAKIAAFINGFNLLPFVPLDGGHYLNETLFARVPVAAVIFKILGLLVLLGFAIKTHSPVLGLFAIFIIPSIHVGYVTGTIAKELRNQPNWSLKPIDESAIATIRAKMSSRLSKAVLQKIDAQPKNAATWVRLIWTQTQKTLPTIKTTVGLLFIYGTILFLGVPILVTLTFRMVRHLHH